MSPSSPKRVPLVEDNDSEALMLEEIRKLRAAFDQATFSWPSWPDGTLVMVNRTATR